jgi:hypothetical protein
MIYEYINDETGEIIEVQRDPREEEPGVIYREGKEFRRMWGKAFHIPQGWNENTYRFDKRPRERRKYK